jgi:hypothetical protein
MTNEVTLSDALFLAHMNGVMEERSRVITAFENSDSACADWAIAQVNKDQY